LFCAMPATGANNQREKNNRNSLVDERIGL
jgi:hypothetical protein